MDKVYVCTQCGEESDAPGSCQICGLALVPMKDEDTDDDEGLAGSTLGVAGDDDEEGIENDLSLEEEQEEEEKDDAYDSFDDEDNV